MQKYMHLQYVEPQTIFLLFLLPAISCVFVLFFFFRALTAASTLSDLGETTSDATVESFLISSRDRAIA